MKNIFMHTERIEMILVTLAGSTLSILMDKIRNRKVTRIDVLFKYIAWSLCGYIAYGMWAEPWIIAVVSIASADIVKYITSKEWIDFLKWFFIQLITKK